MVHSPLCLLTHVATTDLQLELQVRCGNESLATFNKIDRVLIRLVFKICLASIIFLFIVDDARSKILSLSSGVHCTLMLLTVVFGEWLFFVGVSRRIFGRSIVFHESVRNRAVCFSCVMADVCSLTLGHCALNVVNYVL